MSKIKKIIICLLGLTGLFATMLAFAQEAPAPSPVFPPVDWTSYNTSDTISVENSTTMVLLLFVSVATNNNPNAPGINIQNCGSTSHISAGSSVICPLKKSVTFTSDGGKIASGTYQIMKP